jgi:hypothetical protein
MSESGTAPAAWSLTSDGREAAVRDSMYDAPYGAPTAGPPPYRLCEIRPATVFAFVSDSSAPGAGSTRWSF